MIEWYWWQNYSLPNAKNAVWSKEISFWNLWKCAFKWGLILKTLLLSITVEPVKQSSDRTLVLTLGSRHSSHRTTCENPWRDRVPDRVCQRPKCYWWQVLESKRGLDTLLELRDSFLRLVNFSTQLLLQDSPLVQHFGLSEFIIKVFYPKQVMIVSFFCFPHLYQWDGQRDLPVNYLKFWTIMRQCLFVSGVCPTKAQSRTPITSEGGCNHPCHWQVRTGEPFVSISRRADRGVSMQWGLLAESIIHHIKTTHLHFSHCSEVLRAGW